MISKGKGTHIFCLLVIIFLMGTRFVFPGSEIEDKPELEMIPGFDYGEINGPGSDFNVTLKLLSPNGNEILHPGDTVLLTWETQAPTEEVKTVHLEYSTDNGYNYHRINMYFPNTGQYEWKIPHNAPVGSRCLVRVRRADGEISNPGKRPASKTSHVYSMAGR